MFDKINTQSVLTFDGQDDYIDFGRKDIGGVFAEGSSAFTVSGWMNPHQLTDKASTYGTRNVFFARSSDRYSDNFEFGISESGNLDVYIDEKIDNVIKTLGNGELTVGKWHFFALVFNQGQLTVYLDDRSYAASLTGSSLNKATSSVTLGATLHNNIYFTGQLANFSVWNYACSQTEIQTQRDRTLVGNEQGLVAYWTLNEGFGTIIRDQTGNGYDGKSHGNPTWDVAELPFMIAQASQEGERQSETETSVEQNPTLTESETATSVEQPALTESETATSVEQPALTESETATSIEQPALTETGVQQEDSQTEVPIDLAPVDVTDEPQPKEKKEKRKKSANAQTSLTPQSQEGEIGINQTSQSEVLVIIQPQEQEQSDTSTQEESQETMNTTANSKYKILAIDGGGIRGIIPALILAEIEKRTQKPIFSLFDLIAGTSSGGILALGLTKPQLTPELSENSLVAQYSAEDLLQIFLEYGCEIFYEPFFEKILGPIEDIFIQPKYPSKGREEILRQYFGESPLENNLKEVFVTSYDIEQRIPVFFTNKLEKQQIKSQKFRKLCKGFTLTDAALATSATPTYFAPHRIPSSHNTDGFYTLVDGGVVANNPTSLAIQEAQMSRQENKQILNTEDVLVVSLGTGSLTSVYPYNEVKNWGLLQWGRPLLNIVFDGGSEVVAGELERLFESNDKETKSYYRFQTFLTSELEEIDNVKLDNLRELQVTAHRLIAEKSKEIDELCGLLSD